MVDLLVRKGYVGRIDDEEVVIDGMVVCGMMGKLCRQYMPKDLAKINGKWYWADKNGALRGPYTTEVDAQLAAYHAGVF